MTFSVDKMYFAVWDFLKVRRLGHLSLFLHSTTPKADVITGALAAVLNQADVG